MGLKTKGLTELAARAGRKKGLQDEDGGWGGGGTDSDGEMLRGCAGEGEREREGQQKNELRGSLFKVFL